MTDLAQATSSKTPNAYRSIGEAASELGLQAHVLRFWETKFAQLSPVKRPDGRRMYRHRDIQVLRMLQNLLHDQGLTIKGAQKLLKEQGLEAVLQGQARVGQTVASVEGDSPDLNIAAPSVSPVRRLQATVKDAVESGVFAEADESSKDRLATLLDELSDVKVRLDAALITKAA